MEIAVRLPQSRRDSQDCAFCGPRDPKANFPERLNCQSAKTARRSLTRICRVAKRQFAIYYKVHLLNALLNVLRDDVLH